MVCGVLVGRAVAWASFHCCIMMLPNSSSSVSSLLSSLMLCSASLLALLPSSAIIVPSFYSFCFVIFFVIIEMSFWASSDCSTVRLFSHDGPGWHSSPVGSCWFYSAGGGGRAISSTIGGCWFSPWCISSSVSLILCFPTGLANHRAFPAAHFQQVPGNCSAVGLPHMTLCMGQKYPKSTWRSLTLSMPAPLLCSLSGISLYLPFNALILLQNCFKPHKIPCFLSSSIFLKIGLFM